MNVSRWRALVLVGLSLGVLASGSDELSAQQSASRRRPPPHAIVVDSIDCDMSLWPEPHLVPVATEPVCAVGALLEACGAPAPATCPDEDPSAFDAGLLRSCRVSRRVLVALTHVAARVPGVASPLVERLAANVDEVSDDVDRALLVDILRAASR